MSYHTINEEAARRANDMNSFRDYKAGSATAEYRRMVDAATELAGNRTSAPSRATPLTVNPATR